MHFNLKDLIGDLPEQARRTALYSLVGSLNARVIGACSRVVQYIEREGHDVHTEIVNDFAKTREDASLRAASGTGHNTWLELLDVVALRNELRTWLTGVVNDDAVLPYSATMSFMTSGDVRKPPKEVVEALAIAIGLDADTINSIYTMDAARQRSEMAAKSDSIMQVVFALPEREEDTFDLLSSTTQIALANKLSSALNKARNDVVVGMLNRRSTAVMGDIPLINAAMAEIDVVIRNSESGLSGEMAQEIAEQTVAEYKERVVKGRRIKKEDVAQPAAS